jgi:hypothetical protein
MYRLNRVFTGDQRPSMMARGEIQRSSTFIDPTALARPTSQFLNIPGSAGGLSRRQSGNIKPLLSFEDDKIPRSSPMSGLPPNSRSVFGVDKLWEREMVKLREIEAQEKLEEEMLKRKEEEEERQRPGKKNKKKRKGNKTPQLQQTPEVQQGLQLAEPLVQSEEQRVSIEPPVLPAIQRAARRPPPPPADDDGEDDDDESDDEEPIVANRQTSEPAWHAGSSDEEGGGPRRTTGVGPRYPVQTSHNPVEPDSDEDVPLAAALNKALRPNRQTQPDSDHEDEEKPLAALIRDTKLKQSSSHLDIDFDKVSGKGPSNNSDDEDDDQPLGLRASRVPPGFNPAEDGDEDDRPLGLHTEQQRRTQYGFFPQQQQQSMMMPPQMHNSMFFNPSMMGSGFFPSPMVTPMMNPMNPMMMMQAPVPIPSPPPVRDTAKFGRVDKWRRDVAVEGET